MIGDMIAAGGRLIGGFMDQQSRERDRESQEAMAERNLAKQEQFAREGIRWKVHDAKEAGIHPLYALGANTVSFSPVQISGGSASNWSDTLGSMGQDISRAVHATRTGGERDTALHHMLAATQIEGAKLDNDIKKTELASRVQKLKQAGTGPQFPVPEADEFKERPRLASGGLVIKTDPKSANAEDFEARYGEIGQELAGVANMMRDYRATTKGWGLLKELEWLNGGPLVRVIPGGIADRIRRRWRRGWRNSGWE